MPKDFPVARLVRAFQPSSQVEANVEHEIRDHDNNEGKASGSRGTRLKTTHQPPAFDHI